MYFISGIYPVENEEGKKVQIEPFRSSPDINNAKDYVRTTTINEPEKAKIVEKLTTSLYISAECCDAEEGDISYVNKENDTELNTKIKSTFDNKYSIMCKDEVYINIITPKTRDLQGPLIVFDSTGVLFKTHSLCRGSNSNRLKAGGNGDTPTGRATTSYSPKRHKGNYSFGNYGLIYLEGESGEFKTATKNGRAGIAIHCGHTVGYYKKSLDDKGQLMSTHGCIRVYNDEMKKLGALYTELKNKNKTIYCYIEDYDGNISDVYSFYEMNLDPKDTAQNQRSTTQ